MAGFDDFEAARKSIMAAPFTRLSFNLRRFMVDWLRDTKEATGNTQVDLLNNAIGLACFRRLALDHGLQVVMRYRDGAHEFPVPVKTVVPLPDDVKYTVSLTQQNESLLHWAEEERGLSVEHMAHEGVLMLGALAMVPQSKIIIPEFGFKKQFGLELGTSLVNAPPLRVP